MHELLLESGDKDIRTAAGENVAVIFEISRIITKNEVSNVISYHYNTALTKKKDKCLHIHHLFFSGYIL